MTTSASLDAYRSHELNIYMKTSSGDTLSFNFLNEQSLSMDQTQTDTSKESSFSFSSTQAFSFEMNSNGLSEQDKKEINDFLKTAQPYIDKFMKELDSSSQTTPLNKVASSVTDQIGSLRHKDEHTKNHAKQGVVDTFDNALKSIKHLDKVLDRAQTLLEKILAGFDTASSEAIYA